MNATETTAPKRMTYGQGCAIMLLVGERMGKAPGYLDEARKCARGERLHPRIGAAIEHESVQLNDQLRSDAALIAQANVLAQELMLEFSLV